MLCEICHEREATIHTGPGSEGTFSSHFCPSCFQEKGPLAGVQIVAGVQEACHYCGQPCDFGPGKVSVQIAGAVSCCRECGEDFQGYLQHHLGERSSNEDLARKLEIFMKKRIAERDR